MPNYVFFDIDRNLLSEYARTLDALGPDYPVRVRVIQEPTDVRKLTDVDVYVSPANSHGWMDGGIDAIYMEMWKDVETRVKATIAEKSPFKTVYDRCSLPVGGALLVGLENGANQYLVCAPTMTVPQNISNHPENIYWAMYAILRSCEHLGPGYTVAVPGLGTGVGGVSASDSAFQIHRAFKDYAKGVSPRYPKGYKVKADEPGTYLVLPSLLDRA